MKLTKTLNDLREFICVEIKSKGLIRLIDWFLPVYWFENVQRSVAIGTALQCQIPLALGALEFDAASQFRDSANCHWPRAVAITSVFREWWKHKNVNFFQLKKNFIFLLSCSMYRHVFYVKYINKIIFKDNGK